MHSQAEEFRAGPYTRSISYTGLTGVAIASANDNIVNDERLSFRSAPSYLSMWI